MDNTNATLSRGAEFMGSYGRYQRKRKMKKAKTRSYLFIGVSQMILTKIMTLKTSKEIWDYLKEKYEGDERI